MIDKDTSQLFGGLGCGASILVFPLIAIMIMISSPLVPLPVRVWDWTALGLAVINGAISFTLFKTFGKVRALWLIASSIVIVAACPHFWTFPR
jgi:hypothetical protein